MACDSTSTTNPTAWRADFTYSITPRTLVIKDTGKGSVAHLKLTVIDSEGRKMTVV